MSPTVPKRDPTGRDWKAYSEEGVLLSFVLHENRRHKGQLLYDWLLQEAKKLGIPGGSAYRGIAGYGRHGVLHEQHFFELAGDVPVEVRFVCSEGDAGRLLGRVEDHELSLFYVLLPARYGVAGVRKADWPKVLPPVI
jgi:PII-like signaling protein